MQIDAALTLCSLAILVVLARSEAVPGLLWLMLPLAPAWCAAFALRVRRRK